MDTGAATSKRSSTLKTVALITLITFVLLVVTIEVGLRTLSFNAIEHRSVVDDSLSGFRLAAGTEGRGRWPGVFDYRWTTNPRGFRGAPELAIPKPAGTRRVLMVGDSFTFAQGVGDARAWPALVDSTLSRSCPFPVEVVNAGVPGFGTDNSLAVLEHYGLPLQPDVVVYGFFYNDPQDNYQRQLYRLDGDSVVYDPQAIARTRSAAQPVRRLEELPGFTWLQEHSAAVSLGKQLYSTRVRRNDPRWLSINQAFQGSTGPDSAWMLTRALHARMHRAAADTGARFLTVLFPHIQALTELSRAPADIESVDGGAELDTHQRMRGICRERGRCVDIAEIYLQHHRDTPPEQLYFPRDLHFSALGNEIVAEAVASEIATELGCPGSGSGAAAQRASATSP